LRPDVRAAVRVARTVGGRRSALTGDGWELEVPANVHRSFISDLTQDTSHLTDTYSSLRLLNILLHIVPPSNFICFSTILRTIEATMVSELRHEHLLVRRSLKLEA
jgi:hypothetical protein